MTINRRLEEIRLESHGSLSLARRAWAQLGRQRRVQLYLLVVLMVVASIVEVFSIGAVVPFLGVLSSPEDAYRHTLLQPLIRTLGIASPANLILPVTVLFGGGALLSGAFRYSLLWAQTRITYAIGVDFSVRIFERTLHQPYLVHVGRNSSDVIASVSNRANDMIVSLLYPLVVVVSSGIMLLIVLGALALVEPLVTLSTVAAFATFYGVTSYLSHRKLGNSSQVINRQYSNVIRLIQEGLGGIRDVLLDGTQRAFVDGYRVSETELRRSRAAVQIISGTPRFVIETLGTLFIAGLAFRFASGAAGLSSAIPLLGVIALAAQRLIPVAQQLYSSWASIVGGSAAVHDALRFLEQTAAPTYIGESERALPFGRAIQLDNVSFAYAPGAPPILRDVTLTVRKGDRIGIIGATGTGKSTLLDIIMGLLPPTSGSLIIDGRPLDSESLRSWQLNIAHVPQSIFLADASIAENIAFGQPSSRIDMKRVIDAAKTAQIWDVVEQMPNGLGTVVGERGVRLSGGQRQRIGIARALYKQAAVIVLDEATSALDTDTERAVMDAINSLPGRTTLLIVAHRHSTLQACTSIIRIDCGTVQSGSWEKGKSSSGIGALEST